MAKRILKTLTSPEAFGLFVSLLARYANDVPDKTDIEEKFERTMADDPTKRAVATRLVSNFKRIPIARRIRDLRDLAEPKLTAFPAPRFETAFKAMPVAAVNTVIFADDVVATPLPPLTPFERITINFSGIYCANETGDGLNFVGASDETYVITNAVEVVTPQFAEAQNVVRSETHPLGLGQYSNVDSGDFRHGPLAASWDGKPTIVSLVCTVMEHDEGDPDAYKDEIHIIVIAAFAVATFVNPGVGLAALLAGIELFVVEAINWLVDTGDDIVGTVTKVIEEDNLRVMARLPPTLFVGERDKLVQSGVGFTFETVKEPTEILQHFDTKHIGGGGNYNVCFRLKLTGVQEVAPV